MVHIRPSLLLLVWGRRGGEEVDGQVRDTDNSKRGLEADELRIARDDAVKANTAQVRRQRTEPAADGGVTIMPDLNWVPDDVTVT